MEGLVARHQGIEQRLAKRHLNDNSRWHPDAVIGMGFEAQRSGVGDQKHPVQGQVGHLDSGLVVFLGAAQRLAAGGSRASRTCRPSMRSVTRRS